MVCCPWCLRLGVLTNLGLYNKASSRFADPQQLFYRETFEDNPKAFWDDVSPIIPRLIQGQILSNDGSESRRAIEAVPRYSKVHSFFDLLQSKGKLNTIFTQNIDALELAADIEPDRIVACHGSWDTATCLSCDGTIQANDYLPVVLDKKLPLCSCGRPVPDDPNARHSSRIKKAPKIDEDQVCYLETQNGTKTKSRPRPGRKKRRAIESEIAELLRRDSDDDDKFDAPAQQGLLKPNITFFNESIVTEYFPRLERIKTETDLLLIIGTSLAAEPVSKLPLELPADVPQIWVSNQTVNKAHVRGLRVDIELVGDADLIIAELCSRAGWSNGLTNRLWRNHFGSPRQARAIKSKIVSDYRASNSSEPAKTKPVPQPAAETEHKPTEAKTIDNTSSTTQIPPIPEVVRENPIEVNNEIPTPSIPEPIATTGQIHPSTTPGPAVIKSEPRPTVLTPPSILDQINPPKPEPIPLPIIPAIEEQAAIPALKSPPLPFRSGNKRPLSIGDALSLVVPDISSTASATESPTRSVLTSATDSSPARPAKVARRESVAVGKHGALPDPKLKVYADEVFSHITYVTYFKKKV